MPTWLLQAGSPRCFWICIALVTDVLSALSWPMWSLWLKFQRVYRNESRKYTSLVEADMWFILTLRWLFVAGGSQKSPQFYGLSWSHSSVPQFPLPHPYCWEDQMSWYLCDAWNTAWSWPCASWTLAMVTGATAIQLWLWWVCPHVLLLASGFHAGPCLQAGCPGSNGDLQTLTINCDFVTSLPRYHQ